MHFTLKGKIAKAHPYQLDPTLTVYGAGAEAEATGNAIRAVKKTADDHIANKENPHNVTKKQLGLENVDNTSDAEKPISTAQAKAISELTTLISGKAMTETFSGVLLSDGWSDTAPYTQVLEIPGVLVDDNPVVDIDLSDVSDVLGVMDCWKMVGRVTVSDDDTIIAYCYEEKPIEDIPLIFKVVR